jgi:hypothetical protein
MQRGIDGFLITQDQIPLARLLTLRSGLKLEGHGIKVKSGRSLLTIAKKEYGWKGNREKILGLLEEQIEKMRKEMRQ